MVILEGISNVMLIMCISIITTTITGSIGLLLVSKLQERLEKQGYFRILRELYKIVLIFFTIPIIPIISYIRYTLFPKTYILIAQSGDTLEVKFKPVIFVCTSISAIFSTIVGIIFVMGAFRTVIYSLNYIKELRKYTSQKNICDKNVQQIFDNCKAILNIKRNIPVYTSYRILSPMICGVIYPKIYLPEKNYDNDELETIFIHELVHYLHRDILIKYWIFFISNIHWFNPLTKNLITYMNDYCEKYCDIAAGLKLGMQKYLQQLLRIAQHTNKRKNIVAEDFIRAAVLLVNEECNLLKRARNVQHFVKIKKSGKYYISMILIAILLAVFNCASIYAVDIAVTNGYRIFTEKTNNCYSVAGDEEYRDYIKNIEEDYYKDILQSRKSEKSYILKNNKNMMASIYYDIKCTERKNGFQNCDDYLSYDVCFYISKENIAYPCLVTDLNVDLKIGIIEPNGNKRYIYDSDSRIKNVKDKFFVDQTGLYTIFCEINGASASALNKPGGLGSWIIKDLK